MRTQQSDDSIHEILFDIQGKYSTLRIILPAAFPSLSPSIKVIGPCMHPWLDNNQVVIGSIKLNTWNKTSSLKDVVVDILNALQSATNNNTAALSSSSSSSYNNHIYPAVAHKPSLSSSSSYPAADYKQSQKQPYSSSNNSNSSSSSSMYQQQQQHIQQQNGYVYNEYNQSPNGTNNNIPKSSSSSSINIQSNTISNTNNVNTNNTTKKEQEVVAFDPIHVPIPEIPLTFPELEQLSDVQLTRLLTDSQALLAHMHNIAGISIYRKLHEEHRKTNEEIALETLSLEEELLRTEREASLLKKGLNEAILVYKQKLADINNKYSTSKEEIYTILQGQLNSLDDTSESLAKSFINGEIPLTDFVDEYKKLRLSIILLIVS